MTPPGERPSAATPDGELVALAQQGDRTAMDVLLRRHYDRVVAVCRRVTGSDADAADAAQEALILIVRNLAKFDGRSSVGTWIYRIATNASLDELRRRRRRPMLGNVESIGHDATHDVVDPDAGVRVDGVGDRLLLDAALATLPDEFRLPVVLRDVATLDYGEIAEVLGVPIGTVKSRIARGRAALARHLDGSGEDPGNRTGTGGRPTSAS